MTYIYLIIVAVVGFLVGRKTAPTFAEKRAGELVEMREDAHEALSQRTEDRKEKILNLMNSEAVHQKELEACNVDTEHAGVTRLDVEKLLDVSGKTALKYLNELESENKIKQIGSSGPDVYYTLPQKT